MICQKGANPANSIVENMTHALQKPGVRCTVTHFYTSLGIEGGSYTRAHEQHFFSAPKRLLRLYAE